MDPPLILIIDHSAMGLCGMTYYALWPDGLRARSEALLYCAYPRDPGGCLGSRIFADRMAGRPMAMIIDISDRSAENVPCICSSWVQIVEFL